MQDKAIAAIGEWQLNEKKNIEEVDLYIENMFPAKDYQMLLLVFEVFSNNDKLECEYKEIDIAKVSATKEDYRKYAYRKGSARGGDITFTTKISSPVQTKISGIKDATFKKVLAYKKGNYDEVPLFKSLELAFVTNEKKIVSDIDNLFKRFSREEAYAAGLSLKIIENGVEKYLRDFSVIKELLILSGSTTNYTHAGVESKAKNKISSVSGKNSNEVFGFAAPFKYSSPDKPGFISGFFNKEFNWRNYPISSEETLKLELGRKYIQQNLTGYFYGHEYITIPHPIISSKSKDLEKIMSLLKTAFDKEKELSIRAEDRILKTIARENNYFNVDIMFYKEDKKTGAISINLMLEEILPSRFRKLFIETPESVNQNKLFKNAIVSKHEVSDLTFSFQIIRNFFEKDFLNIVQKIFLGNSISTNYVFSHMIDSIRKNHAAAKSSDKWIEPTDRTVKKAIMLIAYLQNLEILTHNKKYKYMEVEKTETNERRFNQEAFATFVNENQHFLDSDIKVGIFAVGVLVKFLYDIQAQSLSTSKPPFENKLRGYKLNPESLMNVYTEALDKIQKYQKNTFIYTDLRSIINKDFILRNHELKKMSNNILSFYFVAGLEMGKQFKNEKNQ